MNEIRYNPYSQTYIIKIQPAGFAFLQVLQFDTLKAALFAANDIYEQYGIIVNVNI